MKHRNSTPLLDEKIEEKLRTANNYFIFAVQATVTTLSLGFLLSLFVFGIDADRLEGPIFSETPSTTAWLIVGLIALVALTIIITSWCSFYRAKKEYQRELLMY